MRKNGHVLVNKRRSLALTPIDGKRVRLFFYQVKEHLNCCLVLFLVAMSSRVHQKLNGSDEKRSYLAAYRMSDSHFMLALSLPAHRVETKR